MPMIYAGGVATDIPDKNSFYQYVRTAGLPAEQFSNNPFGVSIQELQGMTGEHGTLSPVDTSSGGGGGGGGGAAAPDPYAQWGGQARYNSLVSGYNTQKNNIYSTSRQAGDASAGNINSGILDLLDSVRAGQTKIDSQATQNDLSKIQGTRGVVSMVGRGIKSGGVMLANKNASNSSAAEALARAYGDIGRRNLSTVGNQFAQGQNAVEQSQNDLGVTKAQGIRHTQDSITNSINKIVSDAQSQLAQLDGQIASSNLPNRINIEAEKNAIKNEAMGKLQQFDQVVQQGIGGINPTGEDARMTKALGLANAGVAPDNAFSFQTDTPVQFQGTGPFAGNLPIFTIPSSKKTATPAAPVAPTAPVTA